MKIVNCIPFTEEQKKRIEASAPADYCYCNKDHIPESVLQEADVILGNVPVSSLKMAKKLRLLQLNSAGANPYCTEGILPADVILTNASGAYGASVSEHMLSVTLAMMKKLYAYQKNQEECLWKDEGHVLSVDEATVLVVGMGDVGSSYARKMKALGSHVIGVRKSAGACPEDFDETVQIEEIETVIHRADVTAIALPGTPETKGLFDEKLLRKMKRGSYLLNAGRGNIVNTEDLQKVMEEGYLAGAALDVTDPEPLPREHALWKTQNVWITPHVAGGFHMNVTLERIADICIENIKHLSNGEKLEHLVNRKKQY